jgi:CheY-like chemotaxis protein
VYTAASCVEGIKMAVLHSPDCIILDFHLADGNAVHVCSRLKANENTAQIPVIVFSSDPAAEIMAYTECKATSFVLKGSAAISTLTTVICGILCPDMSHNSNISNVNCE